MKDSNSHEINGVTRRTVVRTAAWSVPAIAFAAAAPSASASVTNVNTSFGFSSPVISKSRTGTSPNYSATAKVPPVRGTSPQPEFFIYDGGDGNWFTGYLGYKLEVIGTASNIVFKHYPDTVLTTTAVTSAVNDVATNSVAESWTLVDLTATSMTFQSTVDYEASSGVTTGIYLPHLQVSYDYTGAAPTVKLSIISPTNAFDPVSTTV